MMRGVAALVAYVTPAMTLLPGDVILTGTPGGRRPARPSATRSRSTHRGHRHPDEPGGAPVAEIPTAATTGPVRLRVAPSPDRRPARRHRVHVAVQPRLRPPAGRAVRAADRGHRPRALRRRLRAADLRHAALAGAGLGRGPDVGGPFAPYRQSERLGRTYRVHVDRLLAGRPRLPLLVHDRAAGADARGAAEARKQPTGYDRLCSARRREERARCRGSASTPVVRMLIPDDAPLVFDDLIRGEVKAPRPDDQVILKADGFPTYHLAVVVDDHEMGITHVVRGEEWISSTPKHVLLYEWLGWRAPAFAHMPLLRNADKSKISKRKNPAARLTWFMEQGYLPEALRQLPRADGLLACPTAGGLHLRRDGRDRSTGPGQHRRAGLRPRQAGLAQRRVHARAVGRGPRRSHGRAPVARPGCCPPSRRQSSSHGARGYPAGQRGCRPRRGRGDARLPARRRRTPSRSTRGRRRRCSPPTPRRCWTASIAALEALGAWETAAIEAALRAALVDGLGLKPKLAFGPVRVAVTGRRISPPLFESMELLGSRALPQPAARCPRARRGVVGWRPPTSPPSGVSVTHRCCAGRATAGGSPCWDSCSRR